MACLSLGVAVAAAWVGLKQETGNQRSGGWGVRDASIWRCSWVNQRLLEMGLKSAEGESGVTPKL